MKIRLKVNGFIIFLAVLLTGIFPKVFIRHNSGGFLDEVMEVFGIALILLGQTIRVSARGYKTEHSSGGFALIQDGPYALVRNPMYLGILFIGLGFVMMLMEWWAATVFIAIFIFRYISLIFEEEKKLLNLFTQEYRDYCKRVPRLMPYLNAVIKMDISEYLPMKISWLKKEIGSIIAVLFGVIFIESWKDISTKGWGIYFMESMIIFAMILLFITLFIYLNIITAAKKNDASGKG